MKGANSTHTHLQHTQCASHHHTISNSISSRISMNEEQVVPQAGTSEPAAVSVFHKGQPKAYALTVLVVETSLPPREKGDGKRWSM